MNEPEFIDPSKLRPGPIRNESLPPELLEQIEAVFDVIGPYIDMTLEQFQISFTPRTMPVPLFLVLYQKKMWHQTGPRKWPQELAPKLSS